MSGKCVEDWTIGDVKEILDYIRYVDDLKGYSTDYIIERFKDTKIVDAHQCYVVWKCGNTYLPFSKSKVLEGRRVIEWRLRTKMTKAKHRRSLRR